MRIDESYTCLTPWSRKDKRKGFEKRRETACRRIADLSPPERLRVARRDRSTPMTKWYATKEQCVDACVDTKETAAARVALHRSLRARALLFLRKRTPLGRWWRFQFVDEFVALLNDDELFEVYRAVLPRAREDETPEYMRVALCEQLRKPIARMWVVTACVSAAVVLANSYEAYKAGADFYFSDERGGITQFWTVVTNVLTVVGVYGVGWAQYQADRDKDARYARVQQIFADAFWRDKKNKQAEQDLEFTAVAAAQKEVRHSDMNIVCVSNREIGYVAEEVGVLDDGESVYDDEDEDNEEPGGPRLPKGSVSAFLHDKRLVVCIKDCFRVFRLVTPDDKYVASSVASVNGSRQIIKSPAASEVLQKVNRCAVTGAKASQILSEAFADYQRGLPWPSMDDVGSWHHAFRRLDQRRTEFLRKNRLGTPQVVQCPNLTGDSPSLVLSAAYDGEKAPGQALVKYAFAIMLDPKNFDADFKLQYKTLARTIPNGVTPNSKELAVWVAEEEED